MNENFLQQNPLDLFDDLIKIPEEVFENTTDSTEIQSLMDTICQNDDFSRVLAGLPKDVLKKEIVALNDIIRAADKGEYGNGVKKEMITTFVSYCIHLIEQIQCLGGAFQEVKVKVLKLAENAIVPKYMNMGDAGADIYSNEDIIIYPGQTSIVHTGIAVAIPGGYEIQIRARSGLAAKHGISVLNGPGTIDCEYRGEIGVILHNNSNEIFEVNCGDRIAQMVLNKVPKISWEEVTKEQFDELNTERGEGFGSSGTNG